MCQGRGVCTLVSVASVFCELFGGTASLVMSRLSTSSLVSCPRSAWPSHRAPSPQVHAHTHTRAQVLAPAFLRTPGHQQPLPTGELDQEPARCTGVPE